MAKYIQTGHTGYSPLRTIGELESGLAAQGDAIGNKQTVEAMVGTESYSEALGDDENLKLASEAVDTLLEDAGVDKMLATHLGFNADDPEEMAKAARTEAFQNGMHAASVTAAAVASPEAYMESMLQPKPGTSGVPVQTMSIAGIDTNEDHGIEAFDKLNLTDFRAQAIVSNTLTAATDGWEESFFRTVVLPGGYDGVDVKIGVPNVYQQKNHTSTGAKYTLNKQPITRALYDHKILSTNSADIYPVAIAANDNWLADAADVGNFQKEQGGVTIDTRPLAFGKDIDLLGISTHAGIHSAGDVQDSTDTLHSAATLGDVYLKFTVGGNDAVVAFPTAGMKGSMFVQSTEGRDQEMNLNFHGSLVLRHDMLTVAGATLASLGLHTPLGVPAAEAWQIEVEVDVAGQMMREAGNVRLNANIVGLGAIVTGAANTAVSGAVRTAVEGALTVAPVGYYPVAARSVSNMRGKHLVMEAASNDTYRLQIKPGSPIVGIKPVAGAHGAATLDHLTQARRAKNANDSVTALLAYEAQLANGSDLVTAQTIMGSDLVTPTYKKVTWDAAARTVINRTGDGLSDLVGSLANAITMLATHLIQNSNYLSALRLMTGSTSGYQVVVGVDERIAAILQRSGDDRTLFNQNFRISANADNRVKNKIYVSVRRTNMTNVADPLSFGAHLSQMPMIYNAQFAGSGSSVIGKQQLTPYDAYYMLLPVLGCIDVVNLDGLYYSA